MNTGFARSLRGRLLVFLVAAVSAGALVQAAVSYRTALHEADAIFDYHMQQMAMSLRTGAPLYGPRIPGVPDDAGLEFLIEVWSADGLSIYESSRHALLPQRAVLGFSTVEANGATYRVYSMQSALQTIQIAQDLSVRQHMATAFALRTALPVLLFAPILMLIVWTIVTRSLVPVYRVQKQVATRAADDLAALPEHDLPDEVRPLVAEINLLFARVHTAFETQEHFVADAAHELRSPLTALKLQVQTLQRAGDEPTRILAVERLAQGIDRAARLVEQLLVLARQDSVARARAPCEPVDMTVLVRGAVADAQTLAQARSIDVGITCADPSMVIADGDALRTLVRNLLDNAIKFTPAGGRVDIELRNADSEVVLQCDDSGPGIALDDRSRVFDRFYRAVDARADGSGLGLAIVKAIADRHGASISLDDSAALGGLRVRVAFKPATT